MTSGPAELSPLPTVAEYMAAVGVESVPVHPDTPDSPTASLLFPMGWRKIARDVIPNAHGAWALPPADGSDWADNAVLLVGRLSGPVDPTALLRCAFTDSERLPDWREIASDREPCAGFPSAAMTGTYSVGPLALWTHNRYAVIAVGAVQYLLQLTVTTRVENGRTGEAICSSLSLERPGNTDRLRGDASSTAGVAGSSGQAAVTERDGVAVGVDSGGQLASLSIDPQAYARGPAAVATLILDNYRQAVSGMAAPTPIDSRNAQGAGASTLVSPEHRRPSAPPGGLQAVPEYWASGPGTDPYDDWVDGDEYFQEKRRTGWLE